MANGLYTNLFYFKGLYSYFRVPNIRVLVKFTPRIYTTKSKLDMSVMTCMRLGFSSVLNLNLLHCWQTLAFPLLREGKVPKILLSSFESRKRNLKFDSQVSRVEREIKSSHFFSRVEIETEDRNVRSIGPGLCPSNTLLKFCSYDSD